MKKIVLISPYDMISCIGLQYISSVLKNEGYDVVLIFLPKGKHLNRNFNHLYVNHELYHLTNLIDDCLFVGISVSTNYLPRAAQISKTIKSIDKEISVVWGGIHATVLPRLSLDYCDYVCIGEGDLSIPQFAKSIKKNKKTERVIVPNFWCKRGRQLIKTGIFPLIKDINKLPSPDYDLKGHYLLHEGEIKPLNVNLFKQYLDTHKDSPYPESPELPFHASRGCPYGCTFCRNSIYIDLYGSIWRKVRTLSPCVLVDQLSQIISQYNFIKLIFFSDDDFLLRNINDLEMFSRLYKREIGLPFRCYFTPPSLSERKFEILLDVGLYTFSMGIQSGSDRTNKEIYKRNVTREQVIKAIKIIDKFKDSINTPVHHIIEDNPFETREDIKSTKELIRLIPSYWKGKFFSLTFYPGTELYRRAMQGDIIQNLEKEVVLKDFEKKSVHDWGGYDGNV